MTQSEWNREWQSERNAQCEERHALSLERIRRIAVEESVTDPFRDYFQKTAVFLLEIESVRQKVAVGFIRIFCRNVTGRAMPTRSMRFGCSESLTVRF